MGLLSKAYIPWVEFMWAKYLPNSRLEFAKGKAHHSSFWKSLISLKEHLFTTLCIKIGNERSTTFWFDKYLPSGELASQMEADPPDPCAHVRVSYFLSDG